MPSEKQKLPDNFAEQYDYEQSIWRPIDKNYKDPIIERMRERLIKNNNNNKND